MASREYSALITGTVTTKFGDDINTDYIIPAYLLQEAWDKKFFANYAFERYDPTFVKRCQSNPSRDNIVVAGKNFGCGSSREQAVYAIQYNDVKAVIAESFPDIFFRNSINNSFCVVRVENTSGIQVEDKLRIDLKDLTLRGEDGKEICNILMGEEERNLLVYGGRLGMVKNRLRQRLFAEA